MTAIDDTATRVPQDLDAEQYVLGSMMMSRGAVDEISPVLSGRDFYRPAHETIYAAILDLHGAGAPTELVPVVDKLGKMGELAKVGGPSYLHTLLASVVTTVNARYYAGIVREKAVLRRLVMAGAKIMQLGSEPGGGDVDKILSAADRELLGVAGDSLSEDVGNFGRDLDQILERIESGHEGTSGITWGWPDVDRILEPASPGQMIIVSGRPGMGKTTWVRNVALHAACTLKRRVLFHTLEVTKEETEDALLAAAAGVSLKKITDRNLEDADWDKVAKARQDIDDSDLIIDGRPDLSQSTLRASIRRHRPDFVFVDQLQHMTTPTSGSREEGVSANSRGIKTAAMAEGIPICVVSKMGRGPEQRVDKRPVMADLRESGSLESDADVVVLLFREEVYSKETPRAGEADVIVDKQRRGGPGAAILASQMHYARFVSVYRPGRS